MAITYSHCKPPISCHSLSQNPASISLNRRASNCAGRLTVPAELFGGRRRKRSLSIVAAIGNGGSLDTPLELTSSIGKSLGNVLLNDPCSFFYAVSAELNGLAVDRDGAIDRMELSFEKPEACLHRRIAEMKEAEHDSIIADIIYMIIYKKFKDINVPLTTSIDKDLCYNTWNTSPSEDCDLISIHSHEVMDVIQDFLHSVVWLKAESIASIRLDPTITDMVHLSKIYSTSVNYGYFLKSVSLRFSLEQYMSANNQLDILPSNSMPFALGSGDVALGEFSTMRSRDMTRIQSEMPKPPLRLKRYVQGLDKTAMRVCKEMRSQISLYLIQDHCFGLFSVKDMNSYEPFLISLANLERLVWEAIAFGCFLWDAEEYVDRVYNLRKNLKSTRMV